MADKYLIQLLSLMTEMYILAAGYAIYLIIFIFCLRFIILDMGWGRQRQRGGHNKNNNNNRARSILLIFLILSFIASSADLLVSYAQTSHLVVCHLDPPPNLESVAMCDNPDFDKWALRTEILISVMEIVLYILADGMLFYRAWIIWQRHFWVLLVIGFVFVGSETLQIFAEIVQIVWFNPNYVERTSFLNAIQAAYWVSAFYDIFTSTLIIGRLMYYRRNAKLGGSNDKDSTAIYTSLAAVFFEASLLFSSSRILYAALTASPSVSYIANFWPGVLVDLAAAISPLFIILRLALNSFADPYSAASRLHHKGLSSSSSSSTRRDHLDSEMIFATPAAQMTSTGAGSESPDVIRTIIFGGQNTSATSVDVAKSGGQVRADRLEENDYRGEKRSVKLTADVEALA